MFCRSIFLCLWFVLWYKSLTNCLGFVYKQQSEVVLVGFVHGKRSAVILIGFIHEKRSEVFLVGFVHKKWVFTQSKHMDLTKPLNTLPKYNFIYQVKVFSWSWPNVWKILSSVRHSFILSLLMWLIFIW